MRNFVVFCFIFLGLLLIGLTAMSVLPYYAYYKSIHNEWRTKWYAIYGHNEKLLKAHPQQKILFPQIESKKLWTSYQFGDTYIQLPDLNPVYRIYPIIDYQQPTRETDYGIAIEGALPLDLVKIYFLDSFKLNKSYRAQKIFQLPSVKKILDQRDETQLWEDIFTDDLSQWQISWEKMLRNLYILQLRTEIFPKHFKKFYLLKDKKTAVIELDSAYKNYTTELIMKRNERGGILSFLVLTLNETEIAERLKQNIIGEARSRVSSSTVSKMIYQEYKALQFTQRVSQRGTLYLFSTWTHDMGNANIFKEMVEGQERGQQDKRVLEALYSYASERFGTTFSSKKIDIKNSMIKLKSAIERESQKDLEDIQEKYVPFEDKTPEEIIQGHLHEAKQMRKIRSQRTQDGQLIID